MPSLFGFALLIALASCNEGKEIMAPDRSSGQRLVGSEEDGSSTGDLFADDANVEADETVLGGAAKGASASVGELATNQPQPEIAVEYPTLDFKGKGVVTCKGKSYPLMAQVTSAIDAQKLDLNVYSAHISADSGKVEKKANEKISQSLGGTTYARVGKAERDALKGQGFDYAAYAVFAKSVTKARTGQVFTFDKPLPVFPWPAPAAKYDELVKAGSKTWTANVSGAFSSPITITVQRVSGGGDEQVVKFTMTLAADKGSELYEIFPIPKEATFTVNSKAQLVSRIDQTSLFLGDENCKGGRESVHMDYRLCKRTTRSKTEPFSCE